MKIKNLSNKIIGFGKDYVLPNEEKELPAEMENNGTLAAYANVGLISITGKSLNAKAKKSDEQTAKEKANAEKKAAEDAEKLRLARLASLDGITEEALGALAIELGINPADCKDQKDVLRKVKASLEK